MAEPRPGKKLADAGETLADAKLTIKVGETEIHLEARPEIVRQELDRWVNRLFQNVAVPEPPADRDPVVVSVTAPRVETEPPSAAAGPPPERSEGGGEPSAAALDFIVRSRGRQMVQPGAEKLLGHVTLDPEEVAELFAVDPRGRVFLKSLPITAEEVRDTVLLLLYGALTQRGETSESGYRLVRAVRGMGLRIERVPRAFGPDGVLATSFGRHRSKRYRLTADGIRHCEKLIPEMLLTLRL